MTEPSLFDRFDWPGILHAVGPKLLVLLAIFVLLGSWTKRSAARRDRLVAMYRAPRDVAEPTCPHLDPAGLAQLGNLGCQQRDTPPNP